MQWYCDGGDVWVYFDNNIFNEYDDEVDEDDTFDNDIAQS